MPDDDLDFPIAAALAGTGHAAVLAVIIRRLNPQISNRALNAIIAIFTNPGKIDAEKHAPSSVLRGDRLDAPARADGLHQRAEIGDYIVFVETEEYEDGSVAQVTIRARKKAADGSEEADFITVHMEQFSKAFSLGLQYGVPLMVLIDAFEFTRHSPQGRVQGDPYVTHAGSLYDYVARCLGANYIPGYVNAHEDPRESPEPPRWLINQRLGKQRPGP